MCLRQQSPSMEEFEEIKKEVNSIEARVEAEAENQGKCTCPGCFFGCTLGVKVGKILIKVRRLVEAASFPSPMVAENHQVKKVEHIPGPSIEGQSTASRNLMRILIFLNDDGASTIGVWGMGGVGKTTLVKNLNNKLETATSSQPFSIIIRVTVSKELDLERLQRQLLGRLNLDVKEGESMEMDLDYFGVPQPGFHKGYKIILTSRSLDVCRQMKTDIEVKVDVLDEEESWQLFAQNARKVASLEHIKPIATEVCKECCGLPLALIIVGASMRGKIIEALWKDALNALKRSVPRIKGIEDKVYRTLKWSYDSLFFQGKDIKSCFLYCSLYPEDCSINVKELVQCCIAEGLIEKLENYEGSMNMGIALVENLKDSCLLEDGTLENTVKMHDVVRDVAIWIAYSLEDGFKSFVRSEIGLNQVSEFVMSESLKRVSFMENNIKSLPYCPETCPNVSSLLLQDYGGIIPPARGGGAEFDLLPNLKELALHFVFHLESMSELSHHLGLSVFMPALKNLEEVTVRFCEQFVEFFENASSGQPSEEIEEGVEHSTSSQILIPSSIFPHLQRMKLRALPKLTTLCRPHQSWQHIEQLGVVNCNLIKKFPFTTQNANFIKEIRGESQWWNQLEWDDEDIKQELRKQRMK
ncbi:NB-ARC domain-containing disease resistance protein [Actinidia rufa]|uniref:NB-ARC domain-containing disease resistance protein n=1 Tax=Actinidia rufa TaxID=165716 RepID=A0A7J0G719_9ERIC|nr:NB-ARC domain-containing disease resistance protein [Actinidia rufa]